MDVGGGDDAAAVAAATTAALYEAARICVMHGDVRRLGADQVWQLLSVARRVDLPQYHEKTPATISYGDFDKAFGDRWRSALLQAQTSAALQAVEAGASTRESPALLPNETQVENENENFESAGLVGSVEPEHVCVWTWLQPELIVAIADQLDGTRAGFAAIVSLSQVDARTRSTLVALKRPFFTVSEQGGPLTPTRIALPDYARLAAHFDERDPLDLFLAMATHVMRAYANAIIDLQNRECRDRLLKVEDDDKAYDYVAIDEHAPSVPRLPNGRHDYTAPITDRLLLLRPPSEVEPLNVYTLGCWYAWVSDQPKTPENVVARRIGRAVRDTYDWHHRFVKRRPSLVRPDHYSASQIVPIDDHAARRFATPAHCSNIMGVGTDVFLSPHSKIAGDDIVMALSPADTKRLFADLVPVGYYAMVRGCDFTSNDKTRHGLALMTSPEMQTRYHQTIDRHLRSYMPNMPSDAKGDTPLPPYMPSAAQLCSGALFLTSRRGWYIVRGRFESQAIEQALDMARARPATPESRPVPH